MRIRRFAAVLCTLLLAMLGVVPAATASASPALPFTPLAHPHLVALFGPGIEHNAAPGVAATSYTGQIVNRNSGKCMEVYHSQTSNGANVDQYTCNWTATQSWHFVQVGTSQNQPVDEIVNNNSGKCLEVYHSGLGNGANVDQWGCNGTATQHWMYHDPQTGIGIIFINMNSGLVLEVAHSSTANYGNVDQWILNYTDTQHWDRPILT
jgi:hypothetical protein